MRAIEGATAIFERRLPSRQTAMPTGLTLATTALRSDAANTSQAMKRRALTQDEHEAINAREYPGTRQLCSRCEEATGRCEEDSLFYEEEGEPAVLCEECYRADPRYREDEI